MINIMLMRAVCSTSSGRILVVMLLVLGSACSGDVAYLEPATDSSFAPGQVWRYRTRPGAEGSLLIVGAVDRAPQVGLVVHIKLVDVAIKSPGLPDGVANVLTHLPMTEEALLRSVTAPVDTSLSMKGFEGDYNNWLDAYEGEKLHVYSETVSAALDKIEREQNQ